MGDKKIYCICRKPAGYNRFMIFCDNCRGWFHGSCVKVKKSSMPLGNWFCPPCNEKSEDAVEKRETEVTKIELKEFKNSIISDITSTKEHIESINAEVQSLKSQVSNFLLTQKNNEEMERREKELRDMHDIQTRRLVEEWKEKVRKVEMECSAEKYHEEIEKKEREFRDMHDNKTRCLVEEWEEKVRKVEMDCKKEVEEIKKQHEVQFQEIKEKYQRKYQECMEINVQLEKRKKEIQLLKDRTPSASLPKPPRSLSLKLKNKTSSSQPSSSNFKKDRYDERDEQDFKTPPK